jgi:hypothetical protein
VTGGGAGLAGNTDSFHLATTSSSKSRSPTIVRRIGRNRKSRYRRAVRVIALGAVAALLAGCGGSSPVTLAGCLNGAGFLVTQSGVKVEGTTPGGVGFTLTTYRSPAAARRAARRLRLPRRTTAVVAAAVVDFRGNPGAHARVTRDELATIGSCLGKAQG